MINLQASGPKANREHKSSVFTALFGEKKNLLELYNAITGESHLEESTDVEIVTLSKALFTEQQNDIAFMLNDKLVVLIEHQSTINENMPLRGLIYMAEEYKIITTRRDLYRKLLMKIPTPELIVLYNGDDEYPDFKELRLSDAFKSKGRQASLEVIVNVYNINKGRNAGMAQRCSNLSGYSELIAEVRRNLKTMDKDTAVAKAVKACADRNILVYFLEKHGAEILNMFDEEWNLETALEVEREEAMEKVLALFESGMSLDEVKQKIAMDKARRYPYRTQLQKT